MKTYIKIIKMTLVRAKWKYLLFLWLCFFEVLRNVAFLFSAYLGFSLVVDRGLRTHEQLLLSLCCMIVCELASIFINWSMNQLEETLEESIYHEILSKSSKVSLARLYDNRYQILIRDALEEGTSAITRLAVDLSAYVEILCHLAIFLFVAWQAGLVFVLMAFTCICLAQWQVSSLEKKQENERKKLSSYRNKRKYYTDLLDGEKQHAEVVAQDSSAFFKRQAFEANKAFIHSFNTIRRRIFENKFRASIFISIGAIISLSNLFFRSSVGLLQMNRLMVVILCVVLLYTEITKMLSTLQGDREALFYAQQYLDFLALSGDAVEIKKAAAEEEEEICHIELQDVSLQYDNKLAIDHVSLCFEKGKSTLLIGENGSGKTSLLSIISGLYAPTTGGVICDRKQVTKLETLRDQTAYVSQFFPMLQLSLRESFFCEKCSEEDMVEALKKVDLWQSVADCKKGLDGIVGSELFFSKGQWQLFTIARLLVHKACSIWILDEPTSAMDALHEEKILRLLCQEGQDKILIIVSHRLGFAGKIDRIIHLENGKILFDGNHEQLIKEDKNYRKIFEVQKELYRKH